MASFYKRRINYTNDISDKDLINEIRILFHQKNNRNCILHAAAIARTIRGKKRRNVSIKQVHSVICLYMDNEIIDSNRDNYYRLITTEEDPLTEKEQQKRNYELFEKLENESSD